MKVVILAGGYGTRIRKYVGNEPILKLNDSMINGGFN